MKKISLQVIALTVLSVFADTKLSKAQTFTNGNIAVLVATSSSANNTTASIIELTKTTAAQSAVNTYFINGTSGINALRFSGSASSTGYLSNSNDGSLICFTGGNATTTTVNVNTMLGRGVGSINNAGTYSLATTYTASSGNQTRSATSLDNATWYIGDQSGIYSNGTTSANPAGNIRATKSFNGTVYVSSASSATTTIQVSTISTATGGTISGLPGLTNNSSLQDFYLISSGTNGGAFDILYVLSATSNTVGSISKYSLVSGSWISNGSYTTTFGGFGLAAEAISGGANLYVSTGLGALAGNSVLLLNDATGYNAALAITTGNNVTLYTAAAGTTIKGIAFAPISNCTAPSITSLSSTGSICEGDVLNFSVTATSSSSLTYAWAGPNTYTSSTQNPVIINTTVAASGTYSVTVTNSCGSATSTVTATVNSLPTVTITPDAATSFCAGGSVNLSASSASSYTWSTGVNTPSINVTTGGNYTVAITDGNNCSATSAAISVTVNPLPTTPVITGTLSFCSGNPTILDAGAGYASYVWSNGETTQTISVTTANNFSVTVSDGTCNASSSVVTTTMISTPNQPAAFTASSAFVSIGQNGVAYTVPNDLTATYTWVYSGGGATLNGSTTNSVIIDFSTTATSGTLSVSAINSCGTSASQSILVTVNPASFTGGNIVVLQTIGSTSKASSQITLKEFTTSGAVGTSVSIPTTGSYPLQTSGVFGGSEGFLTLSTDGKFLVLAGYGTSSSFTDITSTTAATVPRVVGTVSQSGAYTQVASSNSFYSGNDIRGAVSDGTNFWASGASIAGVDGINYFGPGTQNGLATSATPPKGYGIRIFNGQIYYSTQKAGPSNTATQLGIMAVSGGSPTSGTPTITPVINTGTITPEDFSFNATTDVCYIAVNLNSALGGIQKWVNTASTWSLAYTLGTGTANVGAYGVLVDYTGTNPIIYATTSESAGNRIIKITDIGASSTASNIVAATSGVFYKGISFAPVNIGAPTVNLSLSTNTALEASATAVLVTATTSAPVVGSQTLSLIVSGTNITTGDYTLSNMTITIPNGATTGTVTFTVVDDAIVEATETASLTISSPSAGILLGTITTQTVFITDNDGNTPPTITMNVATTTDFIDAGVATSPVSPYSVSGASNDPTDPGSTLRIDFLVNDLESAASSLTVTATSSIPSVVPSASIIVSGNGAIRTVKITPIAIGYSTITVTVSDGLNTSSYVISYASSDPSPVLNVNNTFWHTGLSDASDAVAIDDNYYMTGDDELDYINVYSRSASGLPLVSFDATNLLSLPNLSKPEIDIEAGTPSVKISNRSYWLGSMSNTKAPFNNAPNRDRLFATHHTGTGAATVITSVGYCALRNSILTWGDANGYGFSASAAAGVDSKAFNGFAAEGMVFAPDSTTLWIGMRAPLVPTTFRTKAVIVPVLNFETWFNNGSPSGNPTFGSPIELDLNLNGIRDIIRLSNGTYIIIAGGPINDAGTTSMYKWTGNPTDAPVSFASAGDGSINMEGAMEVRVGGNLSLTKIQVISDMGDNKFYNDGIEAKDFTDLNLRKFRSDVLTGVDLDICSGFTSTINASGNTTFCAGDSVKLSAASNVSSYHWSDGETTQTITVKTAGDYSVTVTKASGNCSATSTTETITVNALPATPTISQSGNVLTSSASSTYQWYFNGSMIAGATAQTYSATQNGNYQVEIGDVNTCTATSNTVAITLTDIASFNEENLNTLVKPNPFTNYFELDFYNEPENCSIELYNSLGTKINLLYEITKGNNHVSFTFPYELGGGIYYLKIMQGSTAKIIKLAKVN